MAALLGEFDTMESEIKSERQVLAAQARAKAGKPPLGTRLTGYTVSGEIIEAEAAIMRDVFARFHAGDSLRGIAAWLNETGVPTRRGKPWNPSSVRDILTNPRYCGRVDSTATRTAPAATGHPPRSPRLSRSTYSTV